jgi:hypothetical protein
VRNIASTYWLLAGGLMIILQSISMQLQADADVITVHIEWESNTSLNFEGAVYDEDLNGLPKYIMPLAYQDVKKVRMLSSEKIEYEGMPLSEPLVNLPLVKFKTLKERGNKISWLEIVPVWYDSIAGKYYLLQNLNIEITTENDEAAPTVGLRTGDHVENSVLARGEWYKIPVLQDGIYKIGSEYLRNAGMDLAAINPKYIRIYGNGGGMLPQANDEARADDLIENAVFVEGQSDNIFNSDDYILFYGQGPDHQKMRSNGTLEYEKNFYSDTTFYFLTISDEEGVRMTEREDLGGHHPPITSYDDFLIYEKDVENIINSGRMWFGEKFDLTTTYQLNFDFDNLVPNTQLSVTASIMGQTYQKAQLNHFINSVALGEQTINTIVEGSYLAKGSMQTETFTINTSQIPAADELTLKMTFLPNGAMLSRAFLDYLIIQGKRNLTMHGNQVHFRSVASIDNAMSSFKVSNATPSTRIWVVSDPLNPHWQKSSFEDGTLSFGAMTGELKEFVAFHGTDFPTPGKARKIANQNLHNTGDVDLLIITNAAFLPEARRLADLRSQYDGYAVKVASTEQVYNEFASGKQDATALRDYIRLVYEQGTIDDRLENVLLFGKGSFDYKNHIDNNTNFVPIYSSRSSLHPITSYSSDDYYGFMDDHEGEWVESSNGDHMMDIGVGRLPVKSLEEAKIVVDKLIRYATNTATLGKWRNDVLFVADDGDNNLHQRDADRLATMVDTSHTCFNTNKIYIDAFEQIESNIGETAPEATEELKRSIERGQLIVNYTGHGSPTRLASETILNITGISELENQNRLPLFVTATCEFGRHENPKLISGAEYLLTNENGGAIGLVTTSRPVYSSTNFILNRAFYEHVFSKANGRHQTLGEVFRKTKNGSLNGTINRNFSLLADPSMTLAYAKKDIRITNNPEAAIPGDTLKALDLVRLQGEVLAADGSVDTGFNGKLTATVFDKLSEIETFGHEDSPMLFYVRDNVLFRGEASVAEGAFEFTFIVPNSIPFEFDKGKVSLYAFDERSLEDASGSNVEFVVGGENDNALVDNTPPEIKLFINDTSFVAGGITPPSFQFVARLADESGINASQSNPGEVLTLILDDSLQVPVNQYYVAATDTYQLGWVTYPLQNISIGAHKIRMLAWDVHGNYSESSINFNVVEGNELTIKHLTNYPNPFRSQSTFTFQHNRAGEDLEVNISVFSTDGRLIIEKQLLIENSPGRITGMEWDSEGQRGSSRLSGVYLFRLGIRSLKDGSENFAYRKFVIIN